MNVVIFGNGFGKPRQVNLSGKACTVIVAVFVTVMMSVAFFGGTVYSVRTGSGVGLNEVAGIVDDLNSQRDAISETRQQTEDTLDALAIRIGQMNARIIRMDALGRRLANMADLDDGEFDFDSDPAIGGPEEPFQSGSAVAVPELATQMQGLDNQLADREAQLDVLESMIMSQNLNDRVYPQGRPVKSGWMSSYFGKRTDPFTGKPATHRGVDFAGKMGAEVIAVADGVITWSAARYGYGQLVEINHGNGYSTRYAHNSENLVTVGEEVHKGQTVALMGETGRATGPNLHFEVLRNGQRVNPVKFIRQSSN